MKRAPSGRAKSFTPLVSRAEPIVARKCKCEKKPDEKDGKPARVQRKNALGSTPILYQPKLAVSVPGEPLEQEADRVADAVMSGSRARPCGRAKGVQREAATSLAPHAEASELLEEALAADGEPLADELRQFMESGFGHDFRDVRIHRDEAAARSADAVEALAYTVGRHIVFSAGTYRPAALEGRRLIAHELAHVVQQTGGAPPPAPASAGATPVARASKTKAKKSNRRTKWNLTVDNSYMKTDHVVETDDQFEEQDGKTIRRLLSFDVDTFYLPKTKGPVMEIYEAKVNAEGLGATVDLEGKRPKAGLWQERADTEPLKQRWLKRMGWAGGKAADTLWQQAGGDATFPYINQQACQMDHIVELQLGGTNVRENVQALDAAENRDSGGAIKNQVFGLAERLLEQPEFSEMDVAQVQFNFGSVVQRPTKGGKAPLGVSKKCVPSAAELCCIAVEACAEKLSPEGALAAKLPADREPFALSAGGTPATLQVPKGFSAASGQKKQRSAEIESDPINADACELIPGMILETLYTSKGKETVWARIESESDVKAGRATRLPVTIQKRRGEEVVLNVAKESGVLTLARPDAGIQFTYHYLSTGRITHLEFAPGGGISGRGVINPSIPLLKKASLDVAFAPGEFKVVSAVPKEKLAAPPGVTITQAQLALQLHPEFKPSGTLGFAVGPKAAPFLEGRVEVTADGEGLLAQGDVKANIPGVDEATGKVTYRPAQGWSGEVHITTSKIPRVQSASVTARLGEGGLSMDGALKLVLPGEQVIDLGISRRDERVVYSGKGEFKVPGLEPVQVAFDYDGEHVKGSGQTGIEMRGMKGRLDVRYEDGKVTGKGRLALKKGKADGSLEVKMDEHQRFSGEGTLRYPISQNLIGTAGIVLHEDQRVTVKGALEFPKPIELFKAIRNDKPLFRLQTDIPIPGASIGTLGLVLRITAALGARYGIGPGELQNVRLAATFNPLDDNPDIEGEMTASLVIPARAGIHGSIEGAVAISVALASISGGIVVTASADVEGGARADLRMSYRKGKYSLDAIAEISAGLILGLDLDGVVRAQAGIAGFSVETSKVWKLASFRYDTGLKFGMTAPFHYASGEPFQPPSLDDIKWITPQLDVSDMLAKTVNDDTGREVQKS